MVLDTEIQEWESEGDLEFAVDKPDSIHIRGEPEILKKLFYAFYLHLFPKDSQSDFEQSLNVRRGFKELEEAEAQKRPTQAPEFELNLSNERFYLLSRYYWEGKQIRPASVLRYHNKSGDFNAIQCLFNKAMEKYKAQSQNSSH